MLSPLESEDKIMVRRQVKKVKKQDKTGLSFVLLMLMLAFLLVFPSVSLYVLSSGSDSPIISSGTTGGVSPLAVDSNPQAFALVASSGNVPVIDGNMSGGEWSAARSDTVSFAGSEYFTVYSMINGDYLFVAVRLNATNTDNTLDDNDLCDILFDPDLSRDGSPQSGDLKVECKYSSASGASSSLEIGIAGSWASSSWPSDWMAAVSNGSGEQVYEFGINMSGSNAIFQSLTSGNTTGFGVYVKEQSPGSSADIYWPDDIDPGSSLEDIPAQWGSLIYENPEIKINRVFYRGSGFNERIYVYNNASTNIRLENLTLQNSIGSSIQIPRLILPPGLTLRIIGCNGTNDTDFSDGYADYFIPGGNIWNDSGDYVWLGFSGNNCTMDYMEYGSVSGAYPLDPSSTSEWIRDGAVLSTNAYYFARRADGYDSNRLSDWLARETSPAGKTLHLKSEGTTDFMSTVPPLSSNAHTVSLAAKNDEYHDWLSVPFAESFHLLGNLSALIYVDNNGGKVSGLNATLFDANGTALSFIQNSSIVNLGTGASTNLRPINISIPLVDYLLAKNHSLALRLTATDVPGDGQTPGPQETVDIYWNSTANDSYLYLPTDTYISVDNITYFNGTGFERGMVLANESVNILANISDPLGSYDISNALINITGPGTNTEDNMYVLSTDSSVPSAWKLFNTTFIPVFPGNYTIKITAVESNGVVDTLSIVLEVGENRSHPPVGDHIAVFPGSRSEVDADTAQIEIHALVTNSSTGAAVGGVSINWSVVDFDATSNVGSAFLYENSSITNDSGQAAVLLYTGRHAGDNWKVLADCNGTENGTAEIAVIPGRPHDIAPVSGNAQSATAGSSLPEPLVAEVDDAWGNSVGAGWPVWFNITDTGLNGDAYLEFSSPVLTSAQGMVENILTLDTAPGENVVTAEISGSGIKSAEFTATGTAPYLTLVAGSTAASIPPGTVFNYTLHLDSDGDDVAENISVLWQIPEYLTYVCSSHDSTLSISGGNYTWSLTDMEANSLFIMDITVQVNNDAPDGEISTVFSATYENPLGQTYYVYSNAVNISVNSNAGGSPPHISGVPPLVVHYDSPYTFDLSPYIWDNDTPLQNLTLSFSDPAHAWQGNGTVRMVLLYPEKYNGMQIPLTIVVSDGTASDYQSVMVYVTSDYPPELVKTIPDVTYYEDTVVYPFNISHYFKDPDNDSLVYTYGEVHVICDILPNGTVRFAADKNWFGEEHVTFRATNPSNALVEYTIKVTVIPVNDPPVISNIPAVEIRMGERMTVDLSQYISDPDNNLSELTLSTNSSFASVSGLNITLLYKNKLTSDTIYLTVSDGNATAFSAMRVIIIQPTVWEKIYWPYPLLLLLLPILAALYIYTRVQVEQVFFIYNDGVLIAHETIEDRESMDKDLFSSMLTAIQDFVKDSFTGEGGKGMRLKKLEFGDRKIFIERAENAFLAVVYRGNISSPVERRARKAISEIRARYLEPLENWDGDMARFEGINNILFEILR